MSAFVVDLEHINLIVRVALSGPSDGEHTPGEGRFPFRFTAPRPDGGTDLGRMVVPGEPKRNPADLTPSELGGLLLAENVRSVMHRYPDTVDGGTVPGTGDQWAQPYHYLEPGYRMTCAEAAKAIQCLSYQACEHPQWRDSRACALLSELLTDIAGVMPGSGAAPWCWSERELMEHARRV